MAEIERFGSVYLDEISQSVGIQYNGGKLTIGDTAPAGELPWVRYKKMWVGAQCAIFNISWEQLHVLGLVFGTPVKIDGKDYLCRCLKGGRTKDSVNEWDTILDDLGEDNSLWHWSTGGFWGQEPTSSDRRVLRANGNARYWSRMTSHSAIPEIGFRPVLEPAVSAASDLTAWINRKVCIIGENRKSVYGILESVTDYDLIVSPTEFLPEDCQWVFCDRENEKVIVDRSRAGWLKEM